MHISGPGVQLAPTTFHPKCPDGDPQQVHIDLHVDDPQAGHDRAIELGARILYADDLDSAEGHRVYADPAGHPFFIGWRHPDEAALRAFVERHR
jgi:hypothetical protein